MNFLPAFVDLLSPPPHPHPRPPQATQVKYTTDDFDQRILYEYLAEASVVFPKVFPVV